MAQSPASGGIPPTVSVWQALRVAALWRSVHSLFRSALLSSVARAVVRTGSRPVAPRSPSGVVSTTRVFVVACTLVASATPAAAQADDSPFSVWANRAYDAYEPWETFDTSTGRMNLVFTDLVLPGNGWALRFERSLHVTSGISVFGIAGLPLRAFELLDDFGVSTGYAFPTSSGAALLDMNVGGGTGAFIWMNDRLWRSRGFGHALAA